MLVDRQVGRGRFHFFEAVHQRQGLRVEQGELLLDRDGQIRAVLELLTSPFEQLAVGKLLCLTHWSEKSI